MTRSFHGIESPFEPGRFKPDDKGDYKNSVLGEGFSNDVVCVVLAGQ
ncbi:hypothetical protein [Streptomyces sp. NPDC056821]